LDVVEHSEAEHGGRIAAPESAPETPPAAGVTAPEAEAEAPESAAQDAEQADQAAPADQAAQAEQAEERVEQEAAQEADPEQPQEQAPEQEQAEAPPAVHGTAGTRASSRPAAFEVHLDEFEGPFDLLLNLIAKHKLDVTTLALSKVTDEFISFIHAKGPDWDLDQASEFLLVAATLLDLKAARLLPAAQVEDEEDLALLEARDLLFARLLQYRAYKQVAAQLAERYANGSLRFPRAVELEPVFKQLLPEVMINLSPEQFVALAVRAMTPRKPPTVSIEHIHQIQVTIREQANIIAEKLRILRTATFRALVADAPDTIHVVARFLALLELFRDRSVGFDQVSPFGELTVRWTGSDVGEIEVLEEFEGTPPAEAGPAAEGGTREPSAVPAQRTQEEPADE
jgi:segregation and condensation protein A